MLFSPKQGCKEFVQDLATVNTLNMKKRRQLFGYLHDLILSTVIRVLQQFQLTVFLTASFVYKFDCFVTFASIYSI